MVFFFGREVLPYSLMGIGVNSGRLHDIIGAGIQLSYDSWITNGIVEISILYYWYWRAAVQSCIFFCCERLDI